MKLFLILAIMGLVSCASREVKNATPSPQKSDTSEVGLPDLKVGMSKTNVLRLMGNPVAVRREIGKQVLVYLVPTTKRRCFDSREEYWVVFGNRRVEEFGTATSLGYRPDLSDGMFIRQKETCK
jgi:outer membrane protein assembly factor BamE (lipoprotein component of BamABCDE complex)